MAKTCIFFWPTTEASAFLHIWIEGKDQMLCDHFSVFIKTHSAQARHGIILMPSGAQIQKLAVFEAAEQSQSGYFDD